MTEFNLSLEGLERVYEELDQLEDRWTHDSAWVTGTRVEYAIYLEMGTSKMDPKTFFRPAVAELRMQGVKGFLAHNTRTTIEEIDSTPELIRTLALALERRIKEIIKAKGLIDTGTLRASIAAVPYAHRDLIPSADDIETDENGNAVDPQVRADIEVSV